MPSDVTANVPKFDDLTTCAKVEITEKQINIDADDSRASITTFIDPQEAFTSTTLKCKFLLGFMWTSRKS